MKKILCTLALSVGLSIPGGTSAQDPFEGIRTVALTAADEYRVGREYMAMFTRDMPLVTDVELNARVNEVTQRIISASERPDMVFNIVIIDDPSVNAAALPGGFMFVNKGLLDSMSWDEVAFVIGHEVSHVQLRHFATSLNMQRAVEVVDSAKLSDDPTVETEALEELNKMMTRYARNLELESDLFGLLFAMRAGYSGQSGVDAMESMRLKVGEIPERYAEHASHPTFSQRIEELNKGRETITEAHSNFAAGVAYVKAGDYEAAIGAFEHYLQLFPTSANGWNNLGMCYLHNAMASNSSDPWSDDLAVYMKSDITVRGVDKVSLQRARNALNKSLEIDPRRDAAIANLGVLSRVSGDYEAAERYLSLAMEIDPSYAGYMNNMGNVFASKGALKVADSWYAKALQADSGFTRAKANRALELTKRKKKKPAIALWKELEADPNYYRAAHENLVALGAKPEGSVPKDPGATASDSPSVVVAIDTSSKDDSAEAEEGSTSERKNRNAELGNNLAQLVASFGEPDFTNEQNDGYSLYAGWLGLGFAVVLQDDAVAMIELFSPSTARLEGDVGLGSTTAEVAASMGAPVQQIVDPNGAYETHIYESGVSLFIDADGQVVGITLEGR